MAKTQTMIEFLLVGGGGGYNLTPKSFLEDLQRVNISFHRPLWEKGQLKGSFSKGADSKCLRILNNHVILRKNCGEKEVSKNTGEGYQSQINLQKEEILRPSSEILSEQSTTNAQNDMGENNNKPVILNLYQDLAPEQTLNCHSGEAKNHKVVQI